MVHPRRSPTERYAEAVRNIHQQWAQGGNQVSMMASVVGNASERYKLADINGDGTVDVADIATFIEAMASKSREEVADVTLKAVLSRICK